jgi:hypothetical protein
MEGDFGDPVKQVVPNEVGPARNLAIEFEALVFWYEG